MALRGVHFLLTYTCNLCCDHCFVWGSSEAKGVFTSSGIGNILAEARKLGTVSYVSVEGGEPFLYYPVMLKAVREAARLGFQVEVLSNCYWASCQDDAVEWLLPLSEARDVKISLSSDLYHGETWETEEVRNALKAANALNMKVGLISVKYPHAKIQCPSEIDGVKVGLWELMYRGRAASELTKKADMKPWREFTKCPYEDFTNQGRVHVDPFGYVHVCQGISIGNAWQKPFSKTIQEYDPFKNPILEPLVLGGPVALVERFDLPHDELYADACHLCYSTRCMLREIYPDILVPNQMYGESEKA